MKRTKMLTRRSMNTTIARNYRFNLCLGVCSVKQYQAYSFSDQEHTDADSTCRYILKWLSSTGPLQHAGQFRGDLRISKFQLMHWSMNWELFEPLAKVRRLADIANTVRNCLSGQVSQSLALLLSLRDAASASLSLATFATAFLAALPPAD